MRKYCHIVFVCALLLAYTPCAGQDAAAEGSYSFKKGSPYGSGKWYMGREIANVMGYQGMGWLDRPEREAEENTITLLQLMDIQHNDTIADLGAGSGYHVFRMAPMVKNGFVYAIDIQDEMLAELRRKKEKGNHTNVGLLKGSEQQLNLPENSVDKILIVDVYHEFSYPIEMLASIKKALKPKGKLFLIEYRGEDDRVPIKKLHKMTEKQAVKELRAAGMRLERNFDALPWQHCMVFVKE